MSILLTSFLRISSRMQACERRNAVETAQAHASG